MSTFNTIPDLISSSVSSDVKNVDFNEGSGDVHQRTSAGDGTKYLTSGTIYPFTSSSKSLVFWRELCSIAKEKETKKILPFIAVNTLGTIMLLLWCHTTNSIALTAYTYLTVYDIFSLLTCVLSIWVQRQKPSPSFSFGYERFEVLAVFVSTTLSQLGAFFILKESVERLLEQPDVHTGRLLVGTIFAFVLHMALTYGINNRAMNHVIAASSSSWLQEHMTDMSESVCNILPGLSKLLLPRINPLALIAFAGGVLQILSYILIDTKNYHVADTWAAMSIAFMILGTMFPMSVYTGKILLQTTPSHIIGQLDKLLREASTLDGVLEFREEHFWTLSFGTLAGSVQVRVRRDADEQLVLAHVYNRLSNLVNVLTVQIFKDDWTRGSAYQMFGNQGGFPASFSTNSPPGSQVASPRATSPNLGLDPNFSVPGLSPFKSFTSPMIPAISTGAGHGYGLISSLSGLPAAPLGLPTQSLSGGVLPGLGSMPLSGYKSSTSTPSGGYTPSSLHSAYSTPKAADAFDSWKADSSPDSHGHSHRSGSDSHGHSHGSGSDSHGQQSDTHGAHGHSHGAHSHSHGDGHHGHSH